MENMTTIQLEKHTREELKTCGLKDETYNEIIVKLINIARRHAFFSREKEILDNERFVSLEEI